MLKPLPFRERGQVDPLIHPSVPRGAPRSGEGLGRVRLLLAEMHIAARMFFDAIHGGVGPCCQFVAAEAVVGEIAAPMVG
jgi:hypothetical protein